MKEQLPLDLTEQPRTHRSAALRSYHVRSHVTVPEALEGEHRAARQEDAILEWMSGYGAMDWRYTPSEVASHFPQWPLTSIRRALTNLTSRGLLIHWKSDRRAGPMGAKESTWSLA